MEWSYVYALVCPEEKRVRYIGQSVNPSLRYQQHLQSPGNTNMYKWLTELKLKGIRPWLRIIERCPLDKVSDIEMFWIHHYLAMWDDMLNARFTKSGKVNRKHVNRRTSATLYTDHILIRFPSDVYSKLRKIAEKEDRSINWEVIAAVKLLIEKHEQEHGPLSIES